MCQGLISGKKGIQWWHFMVFLFLAMFRMAKITYRLIYWYLRANNSNPISDVLALQICWILVTQMYAWCRWWVVISFLWFFKMLSKIMYPVYEIFLKYIDRNGVLKIRDKRFKRIKQDKRFRLLT